MEVGQIGKTVIYRQTAYVSALYDLVDKLNI